MWDCPTCSLLNIPYSIQVNAQNMAYFTKIVLSLFPLLINTGFAYEEGNNVYAYDQGNNVYVYEQGNDVQSLEPYMKMAKKGLYPGSNKTRFKWGRNIPIYNQRTSFLYYARKEIGDPMIWATLAMGIFTSLDNFLFDKKKSFELWKELDYYEYQKFEKNVPDTWSDSSESLDGIDYESVYVFKPSNQFGGDGILFIKGNEVEELVESFKGSYVIQKFVDPFLFNNKKTHFRTLTMGIVQPDGTHEYFIYDKIKLYLAASDYDESKLFDDDFMSSEEAHYMLTTNLMANKHLYKRTNGSMKGFDPLTVILDLEDSVGTDMYNHVYTTSLDIHQSVFNIVDSKMECEPTEVSLYDDSCFYIFASDIAMDKNGDIYLLEINGGMGLLGFKDGEIREMADSAASLLKIPEFPYEIVDTSSWEKINVV